MSNKKTTRNARGGGTMRQRDDGRWEARYTVGRHPGTGKQIQKSIYGDTQAEVRKKLAQATNSIDEGVYAEPTKLTVGEWLDIWIKDYVSNKSVKPSTLRSYSDQCKNYIKPALGAVKLSALTPHAIQKFYNELQIQGDDRKILSAKSIKNINGVFHQALEQAIRLGYMKTNPTKSCVLPKVAKADIKPLDEEQIKDFLTEIQGHRFENLFVTALFTGMRQGEILGLTWSGIDFNKGTILVKWQLSKGKEKGAQYKFTSLKNDKSRLITPAPYVMDILKKQKRLQAKMQMLAGSAWANDRNLVFTNELGENLTHVTVYKNFKKVMADMNIDYIRFHDLRHTYAVTSLQVGDDVKTVQENLGHHTAAFTLDVYGHVSERMKAESAARMDKFINVVKGN